MNRTTRNGPPDEDPPHPAEPDILPPEGSNAMVSLMAGGAAITKVENEAMLQYAIQRPRDERAVLEKALAALEQFPEFAEKMWYSIPYKTKDASKAVACDDPEHKSLGQHMHVEGLTIKAAQWLGRRFGNCAVRTTVIGETDASITVEGVAVDYETMFRWSTQGEISKMFRTRDGRWFKMPENQRRQAIASESSKQGRNALFRLIPEPILIAFWRRAVELADQVEEARLNPKAGPKSREQQIANMLKAFAPYNVGRTVLEKFLGRPIESITATQGVKLRGILNALESGEAKAWEVLPMEKPEDPPPPDQPKAAAAGAPSIPGWDDADPQNPLGGQRVGEP